MVPLSSLIHSNTVLASAAWSALLMIMWGGVSLFVGVSGEFPLNDDWAYSIPVRTFLETGKIVPLEWTWTPMVTQVLIGSAALAALGDSQESLRLATLAFGGVAILATFCLARRLGASPLRAFFVAALLLVNPVFINLSFTFMLDVPFTALMLLSLYGVVASIEREQDGLSRALLLIFGALMMLLATLSRQTGIAVGVTLVSAFVLRAIVRRSLSRRVIATLLACAVAAALLGTVLPRFVDVPDVRRIAAWDFLLWQFTRPHVLYIVLTNVVISASYLGMFLSPLVAWRVLSGHASRLVWILSVAATALALGATVKLQLPMPPGHNVIYNMGLGPLTLVGGVSAPLRVPPAFLWGIHAASLLSASMVLLLLVQDALRSDRFGRTLAFPVLLLLPVVYIAPQLPRTPLFDRYLLPLVVPFALGLLMLTQAPYRKTARHLAFPAAIMAGLVVYATVATRDYMGFQRDIWRAAQRIEAQGVPAEFIDAGFEHWGLYGFQDGQVPGDDYGVFRPATRPYVLSFLAELPKYRLVDRGGLWSTLLQRKIPLYTHRREPQLAPPTIPMWPL